MVWPQSTYRVGLATVNIWKWHGHSLYIGMVWPQSIYRDGLGTANI